MKLTGIIVPTVAVAVAAAGAIGCSVRQLSAYHGGSDSGVDSGGQGGGGQGGGGQGGGDAATGDASHSDATATDGGADVPTTLQFRVTASTPAGGATGVDRATTIQVTFSDAVDQTTVGATTFQVLLGGVAVAGQIQVATDGKSATFTPASSLGVLATYSVQLSASVKSAGGDPLTPFTASFSTVDGAWSVQVLFSELPGMTFPTGAADPQGHFWVAATHLEPGGPYQRVQRVYQFADPQVGWQLVQSYTVEGVTNFTDRPTSLGFAADGSGLLALCAGSGTTSAIMAASLIGGTWSPLAASSQNCIDPVVAVMGANRSGQVVFRQLDQAIPRQIPWSTGGLGSSSPIDSGSTPTIAAPSVAASSGGGVLAVWGSMPTGGSASVRSAYYSASTGWGPALDVPHSTGLLGAPAAAVSATGDGIAAFATSSASGSAEIWTVRFVASTGRWDQSSPQRIAVAGTTPAYVTLSTDPAGAAAAAAWIEGTSVMAVNRAGGTWGNSTSVISCASTQGCALSNAQIAMDASGNGLLAWKTTVPNMNGTVSGSQVYATRFTPSSWGTALMLEGGTNVATPPGVATGTTIINADAPSVVVIPDGRGMVTFDAMCATQNCPGAHWAEVRRFD
jgi:hypothetical protein